MAETPSIMVPLGSVAPAFKLRDTISGRWLSLDERKGKNATVIMFICNHCPYVKHVNAQLVQVARDYGNEGVSFIAISSNDAENYPDDSPDKMTEAAARLGYPFPYLYDETQNVAIAYDAACTPDIFVYDSQLKLVYRGQLDDSRPGNGVRVTGKDLRAALHAILTGGQVPGNQKPSVGCNIKWRH